jgi:universal stress protein E
MLKSLLVASDLSKRSAVAVERAVQLSGLAQAQLTVLHVVEDDLLGHVMRDEIKTVERSLGDQVAQLAQQIDCRIKVAAGHAFHVIGEEARSVEADLLIMGAHRRQFLRDIFTGTTIERVTRSAGCPVLMAMQARLTGGAGCSSPQTYQRLPVMLRALRFRSACWTGQMSRLFTALLP